MDGQLTRGVTACAAAHFSVGRGPPCRCPKLRACLGHTPSFSESTLGGNCAVVCQVQLCAGWCAQDARTQCLVTYLSFLKGVGLPGQSGRSFLLPHAKAGAVFSPTPALWFGVYCKLYSVQVFDDPLLVALVSSMDFKACDFLRHCSAIPPHCF